MIKRLARTRTGRWLLTAAILAGAIGVTYVATHTEGEITGPEKWISVNIGPGAVTVYASFHGWNGATVGSRYDHWNGTSTDLGSVAAYAARNGGVAVGIPGGFCAGYEVYGAPGDPGVWVSRAEC